MADKTLDFFDRIPERAAEAEVTELNRPWTEERWLLTHPSRTVSITLTDEGKAVWDSINGERTVRDLLATLFQKAGSPVDIETLLARLERDGFIRWKDKSSMLDTEAARFDREMRRVLSRLICTEVRLPTLASFLNRTGRRRGVLVVSSFMIFLYCFLGLIACVGLYVHYSRSTADTDEVYVGLAVQPSDDQRVEIIRQGDRDYIYFTDLTTGQRTLISGDANYALLRVSRSVLLGLALFAVWLMALPFIAQFLYGLGVSKLGLRIHEVAIRFRFGLPSLQVWTEDPVSLTPSAFARLLLARTAIYLGMAGVAVLLLVLSGWEGAPSFVADVLAQLALAALLLGFLSLSPLLPTQAHRSLCSYLRVKRLRRLAFQYLGRELVGFLAWRKKKTIHGKILLVFAAYTCVWTIVAIKLASIIFRSEIPVLLSNALFVESMTAVMITLVVLFVTVAGIVTFVFGSIFFVTWKISHWIWLHAYPRNHKHKVLTNIPVAVGLAFLVWTLPEHVDSGVVGMVVPSLFALSVFFMASAGYRLNGSIWCLPLCAMAIASVGFTYSFVEIAPPSSEIAWRVQLLALVFLTLALLWLQLKASNLVGEEWQLVVGIGVVVFLAFVLPSFSVLSSSALFLVATVLAVGIAAFSRGAYAFPVWISLGLSCLALFGAVAIGRAEEPSVLQATLMLIGGGLWLNAAFGFRQLLADVPVVSPSAVRRRAQSDGERLLNAYLDLRALMRGALAAHLGERLCDRYETRAGDRIDAEEEPGETEKISALALHLDNECHLIFEQVRKIIGRRLLPQLVSAALHRIFWMEREVLVQHVSQVASVVGRDEGEAIDASELLVRLPLFSGLDEDRRMEVASLFQRRRVAAGTTVISQGEPGREFYLIARGTASVEVEDDWGRRRTVAHLVDGDYFGEVALLQDVPRTATVVAQTPLDLFVLGRQDLRTHLTDVSTLSESIKVSVDRLNMLRGISLFRRLPPALVSKAAAWFEPRHVKTGDVIIREGEHGEAFYAILKGSCQVVRQRDDAVEEELARLGPGEYFGEISLILQKPTTATVQAMEPTELLRLPEDRFLAIFRESTFFAESVSRVASRRAIDTAKRVSS